MYLDPGSGSMLIQLIIALVAAGGAIFFALRKKISNFFSKNKKVAKTKIHGAQNEENIVDTMEG